MQVLSSSLLRAPRDIHNTSRRCSRLPRELLGRLGQSLAGVGRAVPELDVTITLAQWLTDYREESRK
jgi:hypothetical protein